MVWYEKDQKPAMREVVYCDMDNGRTRLANYSPNFIILPKSLRPLWDGIVAQVTVEELIDKHLVANFPGKEAARKEQAERETFELLSLLMDRRIISMGYRSIWQTTEQEDED